MTARGWKLFAGTMTRLLIPMVLALLGALIGYVLHTLAGSGDKPRLPALVAGAVGAFAGLVIRDLMDIEWGGDLGGSLIAVMLGATLLSWLVTRLG